MAVTGGNGVGEIKDARLNADIAARAERELK
jgi:hypothetical protein